MCLKDCSKISVSSSGVRVTDTHCPGGKALFIASSQICSALFFFGGEGANGSKKGSRLRGAGGGVVTDILMGWSGVLGGGGAIVTVAGLREGDCGGEDILAVAGGQLPFAWSSQIRFEDLLRVNNLSANPPPTLQNGFVLSRKDRLSPCL